ncbi:MAG: dihydroorotase [Candidatus Omnitrophota bacterium]
MKLLIKNGHVVDPANHVDGVCDILIEHERIAKVGSAIKVDAHTVIDATGKIVIPGIVDMHVHLREPGREDKETVSSGTKAALHGGVTSMLAMANTLQTIDCPEAVRLLRQIIEKTAYANVYITAAITKGRMGEHITDIARLKKEGAIALSDDGASVDADNIMLEALKKAKKAKMLVLCHSEDKRLSAGGVMNAGFTSTKLGLRGISKESEYKRVQRDIDLAASIDACVHITHVSCKESVEIVAQAKKKGIRVTADTAPHYFSLSEEAVSGYDTNTKMNPPLRGKDDMLAIQQALRDGTIDAIASDHAPHTENEKEIEFDRAEFGVIGLETELSVSLALVHAGALTLSELIAKLTRNPAKILGIPKGTLSVGADADVAVFSKDREWLVEKKVFFSKSKNSAFLGKTLKGLVEYTFVKGKRVYPYAE